MNCVAYFEAEKSKKKSRAAFYNHLRQPGYPYFLGPVVFRTSLSTGLAFSYWRLYIDTF